MATMNTTSQVNTAIDDLLAPVERALAGCAPEGVRVADASRRLRQATDALEDAASDDWRLCAQTLANLLEIVDCFAEGSETLATETTDSMVEFVRAALSDLRGALTESSAQEGRPPLDLVEQARSRWGEYLTLLDGDGFQDSQELDQELAEIGAPRADFTAERGSSHEQMKLILSAMKGPPASSGTTQVAKPHQPETGPRTPNAKSKAAPHRERTPAHPRIPAAPQRISISETLLEAYLEDADQCLSSMERSVIAIENQADPDASVKQLCRDLHTLKGASASIGLSELATYLHEIEEWLQAEELTFAPGELQPILDCVDFVRLQIETLQHPEAAPSQVRAAAELRPAEPHASPKPRPSVPAACDRSAEPGEETIRVRSSQLDRMMNLLVDLVIWRRQRDRHVVELDHGGDELSRCVLRLERYAKELPLHRQRFEGSPAPGQPPVAGRRETSTHLGELVSDLREIAASLRECRQSLADENRAVSHFIQQFRQQLTQIRRVPLQGLFQRLQRVARDAARIEGKQVRLECRIRAWNDRCRSGSTSRCCIWSATPSATASNPLSIANGWERIRWGSSRSKPRAARRCCFWRSATTEEDWTTRRFVAAGSNADCCGPTSRYRPTSCPV
jgi:HPt (histidine-containing phosphotransfer) domain-containing protein